MSLFSWGRGRASRAGAALAACMALSACGGKIGGETDPTATRVTGTKTGTPSDDPTPPAPALAPTVGADLPAATEPPFEPPNFAWAGSCPAPGAVPAVGPKRPPPPADGLAAYLDDVRAGMVGHWRGVVTTPWTPPSYDAYVAFEADGHYASRAVGTPAFYYGTDFDTPLKQWRLEAVTPDGHVSGSIDIAFRYDTTFGLPGWQGELHDVTLDAPATRLSLSFFRSDGYGPVHFDLWRCGS